MENMGKSVFFTGANFNPSSTYLQKFGRLYDA